MSKICIVVNFIRIFFTIYTFNSSENLRLFEYLRRNSYLRRSSKISQNSEESSSSVYFPDLKILRLRLRSIINLRCNTDTWDGVGHSCSRPTILTICTHVTIIPGYSTTVSRLHNSTNITQFCCTWACACFSAC